MAAGEQRVTFVVRVSLEKVRRDGCNHTIGLMTCLETNQSEPFSTLADLVKAIEATCDRIRGTSQ